MNGEVGSTASTATRRPAARKAPTSALTVVDYERYQTVQVSPAEAWARLQQDKLHQWMKSTNPQLELPMMGLLNNYDGVVWQVKPMVELLAKPDSRARLVRDATQFALNSKESGIVLDFEEVPERAKRTSAPSSESWRQRCMPWD